MDDLTGGRRIERRIALHGSDVELQTFVREDIEERWIIHALSCVERYLNSQAKLCGEIEVSYGAWPLKIISKDMHIRILELDQFSGRYIESITRSITTRIAQVDTCSNHEASFDPPSMTSLCAASDRVMEGDHVQGIRYPSPEHMSGWYFTTDGYREGIDRLRTEHLFHLAAVRPEILSVLALPPGYGFMQREVGMQVYYDPQVADEPSNL